MLPEDNYMLLSFINTKLRDFYKSLYELCEDLELDMDEIIERLESINYVYNLEFNCFTEKQNG